MGFRVSALAAAVTAILVASSLGDGAAAGKAVFAGKGRAEFTLTGQPPVEATLPRFEGASPDAELGFAATLSSSPYVSVPYSRTKPGDTLAGEADNQTLFAAATNRGGPPAAAPTTASLAASPAITQPAVGLQGSWEAQQASSGSAAPIAATLTFTGDHGTMQVGADAWPLFEVKQMGTAISFTLIIPGTPYLTIHYAGTLTSDALEATSLDEGQGRFRLTARRATGPLLASPKPPATRSAPPPPASLPQSPAPAGAFAARAPAAPPIAPPIAAAPVPQQRASLGPAPLTPAAQPEGQAKLGPPARAEPAPPAQTGAVPSWRPIPASAAAPEGPVVQLPLPPLHDVAPVGRLSIPPMGWATREKLGTGVSAEAVRQAAEGLDVTGLKGAGYTYLELDDGWQGARDANGVLHPNAKFPDMKALVATLHASGLKFSIATSAGPKSCDGSFIGSYGHEAQDARAFADWGVDAVIYEWCGAAKIYTTPPEMRAALQKMGDALRATGHNIAYGIATDGSLVAANFAAQTGANFWRTGKELSDSWQSLIADGFALAGAVPVPPPGHWLDPGLIQAGNGGMAPDEYRMQLNLWAVIGGPFMLGDEVRIMRRETVDLLTNKEVLAVDEDSGGPGRRVAKSGDTEVWAKPLTDGSIAVGFFNHGNVGAPVAVSWDQLGIRGERQVRDLWWHQPIGTANNRYVVFLTAHTSLLLRMSK
jgi:alpha-galactosidase